MFLVKASIKRPIMTTMGILTLLLFGFIAYNSMNLNQMPDVEIPYITISTVYPGAGPKEIEGQITKKIEDAVSTVSEIEKIESYSLDGVSIIVMEFKLSKDVNVANQEVKSKVDEVMNDLPSDAKDPIIQKVDLKAFPIVDLVLSGNQSPKELYEIADKKLKDRFSQIGGVAKVNITGGQKREVQIIMDNKTAFENGVSLPQMLQVLAAQNMDIPGGYFQDNNQELTVRFSGKYKNLDHIRDMEVPTLYGPKKISQFADVVDGGQKIREKAVFFDNRTKVKNENVVRLSIVKSSDGNEVVVAKAVLEALPEIQASLPPGVTLKLVNDASVFTEASVNDLIGNLQLGILFTAVVLFLFLFDWRSTLIIALSMPTSIIITFLLMDAVGMSKNMMSLMGLSVSVGVLVANSVVVIENIFRHKGLGENSENAAYKGTTEVVVAVLASTLTNIVVFLPIAAMTSMVGKFMVELALSATFASILSIFMSFTLTPMLAKLMLPEKLNKNKMIEWADLFEEKMKGIYSATLRFLIKSKWIAAGTIVGSFAMFIAVTMIFGPKLGFEFVPLSDDAKISVNIELPTGYNLSETEKVVSQIENRLKKYPEVIQMLTNLGKKSDVDLGTNMARMDVKLLDAKDRAKGIDFFIGAFIKDLSDIPNVKLNVDRAADQGGPGQYAVDFFVTGPDVDKLEQYKNQIVNKMRDIPGLLNFDNSSRSGKPEITIRPRREIMNEAGLTAADLAITLRASMEGMEATKYSDGGNDYALNIFFKDSSTNTPEKVANITVIAPTGVSYRMSQLADIRFTNGYTKILHRNKATAIQFMGSNSPDVPVGNITQEIEKRMKEIKFEPGYSFMWGGNTKMMNDMVADMLFAFALAIVLTYILLAAVLESFIQPIYILVTLPLALIGVILALYMTNTSLGITALMAIIMLIGIVVNNAILILDHTNQLVHDQGYKIHDALLEASPIKLKPIIMSTLALILGMLPMALGIGDAGKEMRLPLAVVSIGGLVTSALLTLWVIPAFYYLFGRDKKKTIN